MKRVMFVAIVCLVLFVLPVRAQEKSAPQTDVEKIGACMAAKSCKDAIWTNVKLGRTEVEVMVTDEGGAKYMLLGNTLTSTLAVWFTPKGLSEPTFVIDLERDGTVAEGTLWPEADDSAMGWSHVSQVEYDKYQLAERQKQRYRKADQYFPVKGEEFRKIWDAEAEKFLRVIRRHLPDVMFLDEIVAFVKTNVNFPGFIWEGTRCPGHVFLEGDTFYAMCVSPVGGELRIEMHPNLVGDTTKWRHVVDADHDGHVDEGHWGVASWSNWQGGHYFRREGFRTFSGIQPGGAEYEGDWQKEADNAVVMFWWRMNTK